MALALAEREREREGDREGKMEGKGGEGEGRGRGRERGGRESWNVCRNLSLCTCLKQWDVGSLTLVNHT